MRLSDESKKEHIRGSIRQHLTSFWPKSRVREEKWSQGPIEETLPGFHILTLEPKTRRSPKIYVTNGCFLTDSSAHPYLEFFLLSPNRDQVHLETLSMLAHFHADSRYRLMLGKIVNIGRPWLKRSTCNHLLISLPYTYGPKLEWLELGDSCVRFLWALPITAREAAYAELNGYDALEQKFDEAKLDYLNPTRSSVL